MFSASLCMWQLSDTQTYVKTLGHLHLVAPGTIIVLESTFPTKLGSGQYSSALIQYIQEDFPDVNLAPASRKYWNETAGKMLIHRRSMILTGTIGLEYITQLIVDGDERAATLLSISEQCVNFAPPCECRKSMGTRNRAFALCSAAALFKYMQAKLNTIFPQKSLSIQWTNVQGKQFNQRMLMKLIKTCVGIMLIDHESAKSLELIGNAISKKSKHSLFG